MTWVLLSDLRDAANYVSPLMGIGAETCELLVAPVLKRSVANFREAPRDWNDIPDTCAALLLEAGGVDDADLDSAIEKARSVLTDADLIAPLTFDKTVDGQRGAWHIRNGSFGVIGSDRHQGTTLITEGVCFPPALVGQGAADLLDLLASYEYPEMVMGHAAFGKPHFFILPHFGIEQEREKSSRSFGNLGSLCKAHSKARHPPSEF
ncbi:FAD-linked oxidase C-terminal domain-containing protein [Corynebacterium diphtheriae]|uniref:FAD-linked oxidase C-terminal domain-containing protein n=1 Tax=Corynebacterium diphtheriae TaxID=1717 RepID=UPI00036FF5E8|nr:FAD-linked oxidase C-terminal domain-containing protein [Corynebacterium diphtheriae]OJI03378.1 FAD-linked oxidase [Corynebacterium diphtheriae]VEJ65517.1 D-lactate dehydrogenase [Corynebacterium diphtheriae]